MFLWRINWVEWVSDCCDAWRYLIYFLGDRVLFENGWDWFIYFRGVWFCWGWFGRCVCEMCVLVQSIRFVRVWWDRVWSRVCWVVGMSWFIFVVWLFFDGCWWWGWCRWWDWIWFSCSRWFLDFRCGDDVCGFRRLVWWSWCFSIFGWRRRRRAACPLPRCRSLFRRGCLYFFGCGRLYFWVDFMRVESVFFLFIWVGCWVRRGWWWRRWVFIFFVVFVWCHQRLFVRGCGGWWVCGFWGSILWSHWIVVWVLLGCVIWCVCIFWRYLRWYVSRWFSWFLWINHLIFIFWIER